MSVRQYECKFSHLLHNIEDVGLQLLRSVCSHPEVQLQVIGVTFECLTYTCSREIQEGHISGRMAMARVLPLRIT